MFLVFTFSSKKYWQICPNISLLTKEWKYVVLPTHQISPTTKIIYAALKACWQMNLLPVLNCLQLNLDAGFAVSFKAIRFTLTSITDGQIDVHIIPAPDLNMTDRWTQWTVLDSVGQCWTGPNKNRYTTQLLLEFDFGNCHWPIWSTYEQCSVWCVFQSTNGKQLLFVQMHPQLTDWVKEDKNSLSQFFGQMWSFRCIYFGLSEMEFDTFESLLGPVSKFPLPVKLISVCEAVYRMEWGSRNPKSKNCSE